MYVVMHFNTRTMYRTPTEHIFKEYGSITNQDFALRKANDMNIENIRRGVYHVVYYVERCEE